MDQLTNTEGVLFNFFQVLCPNAAELIVETVSRFDYAQGSVGMSGYPQYWCFNPHVLQHTCLEVSSESHWYAGSTLIN